jgi:hypothetical protein
MAIDEPRKSAAAPPVDLDNVVPSTGEVAHATDLGDPSVLATDVRVFEHADFTERGSAQRRLGSRRCGDLRQVSNEECGHRARRYGPL